MISQRSLSVVGEGTFLEWLKSIFTMRDDDIEDRYGEDALQYLRFQRYIIGREQSFSNGRNNFFEQKVLLALSCDFLLKNFVENIGKFRDVLFCLLELTKMMLVVCIFQRFSSNAQIRKNKSRFQRSNPVKSDPAEFCGEDGCFAISQIPKMHTVPRNGFLLS